MELTLSVIKADIGGYVGHYSVELLITWLQDLKISDRRIFG
jgi:fructose 1,6-bisphosphatase